MSLNRHENILILNLTVEIEKALRFFPNAIFDGDTNFVYVIPMHN